MTTVNDLIARLQELAQEGHGDTTVMFSYNYGDHWRTQVAVDVNAWPETATVEHSGYHGMDKVIDNDEDRDPEDQTHDGRGRQVIML